MFFLCIPTKFSQVISTMDKLLLFKTQSPFVTLLMIFLSFVLLLINVMSDSLSFNFPNFRPEQEFELGFHGDARPLGGVIQLTRRDGPEGTILQKHNVGRVVYLPPLQLWDKNKGKVADFETEFSFVVENVGSPIHGDGLSFFIIPYNADARMPRNSSGGFLGLFSPETAFDSHKNQIVAIEFDSFRNEWDPETVPDAPHIGIDINSLKSVKTEEWPINYVPVGSIGKAHINYNSKTKELSVLVGYHTEPERFVRLTHIIDLQHVLPELVRIGFSGATGDQVETHDILSWSFTSRI